MSCLPAQAQGHASTVGHTNRVTKCHSLHLLKPKLRPFQLMVKGVISVTSQEVLSTIFPLRDSVSQP